MHHNRHSKPPAPLTGRWASWSTAERNHRAPATQEPWRCVSFADGSPVPVYLTSAKLLEVVIEASETWHRCVEGPEIAKPLRGLQ